MKKIISLILCAIMIVCAFAVPSTAFDTPATRAAIEYTLDANQKDAQGIYYTLNADGSAVVGLNTYSDSASSGYTGNGAVIIPEVVSAGGNKYNVTAIGRNAFDGTGVTSVIVGNNVTTIGEMAFAGCESLRMVVTGTNTKTISGLAFWHCCNLVSVTLTAVETIGGGAFWSCVSLVEITLPASVTTVMEKAFWNCSNLVAVNLLGSEPATGVQAYDGCAEGFKTVTTPTAHIVIPAAYGENGQNVTVYYNVEGNNSTTDVLKVNGNTIGDVASALLNGYNGCVYSETIAAANKTVDASLGSANASGTVAICDHATTEKVVAKSATCYEAGVMETVCTKCHKVTATEAIAQLNHAYKDIVTEPTCTEGGYTTHKCTICHDRVVDTEVPANNHNWDEGSVTTKSTIDAHGVKKFICQACKRVDNQELPFIGDVNNDGKQNAKDVSAFLKMLAGQEVEFVSDIADVSGDGNVNSKDVSNYLKWLAGDKSAKFGA